MVFKDEVPTITLEGLSLKSKDMKIRKSISLRQLPLNSGWEYDALKLETEEGMSGSHKVTLEDIMPAMDCEIVLASSCDSRTRKSKDLKFNPAQLKYRVRYYDGQSETSNNYSDPLIAIDKYNSHQA